MVLGARPAIANADAALASLAVAMDEPGMGGSKSDTEPKIRIIDHVTSEILDYTGFFAYSSTPYGQLGAA
jgi:hypothetical protein